MSFCNTQWCLDHQLKSSPTFKREYSTNTYECQIFQNLRLCHLKLGVIVMKTKHYFQIKQKLQFRKQREYLIFHSEPCTPILTLDTVVLSTCDKETISPFHWYSSLVSSYVETCEDKFWGTYYTKEQSPHFIGTLAQSCRCRDLHQSPSKTSVGSFWGTMSPFRR